jgi:hypothetical protein
MLRVRRLEDIARPLESDVAIALADWMRARRIKFIHIPNGELRPWKKDKKGRRYSTIGKKLARMGVQADFPDYLIFTPPPNLLGFCCAAFELKRIGERLREGQKEWLRFLQVLHFAIPTDAHGVPRELAGYDDAVRQLQLWGYGRR